MAAVEHLGGARAATETLYSRYGKQIYSYCLHKLRSREEAEDAVQTTFMNAFRSLDRGATTEYEQAWLYKIAQNVCLARQTSSSKRLRLESPNDLEVLQEVVPAREGERPLDLIGLEDALERMPENQRRAILLREWQGLSYREISEELELSPAAVEMLIFRARRALAGALERPEERKRVRVGKRVGSLGSLVAGSLKTLFGGGAAIKAASIAAAAIAVVGVGAQHTIVHHAPPVRTSVRALSAPAARHVAALVSARRTAPALVHTTFAHVAVPAAPPRVRATARPQRGVAPVRDAAAPVPVAAPAPAPTVAAPVAAAPVAAAPVVAAPVVAAPVAAAPVAAAPVAAPAAPPVHAPEIALAATTPAPPAPEPTPTTTTTTTTSTTTTPPAPATSPRPVQQPPAQQPPIQQPPVQQPPAQQPPIRPAPPQTNGNGDGHGNGHGNGGNEPPAPAPVQTVPAATPPAATPPDTAPPETAPPTGNDGNGRGRGRH